MYAIILTGGKQVKAEVGKTVYCEKINGNVGDQIVFDKVLFAVSGALALALFLWRRAALQKLTQAGAPEKKVKKMTDYWRKSK